MRSVFYFDTSAITKRYFTEPGSETVRRLLKNRQNVFVTSSLTYAELYTTAYRLGRDSVIEVDMVEMARQQFEKDWKKFLIQEFSAEVRKLIPEIAKNNSLKGADAVHLASALFLHEHQANVTFVASDKKLLSAAKARGLPVFNPEMEDQ